VAPFQFRECVYLVEPTGRAAATAREFLQHLEEIPWPSILYHIQQSFLRHHFDLPVYTNDFSNWAATDLEDRVLAEKLANITISDFESVDTALREHICTVINDHLLHSPLADVKVTPFFFDSATIIILKGPVALNYQEFRAELARVDETAIYFHCYAARWLQQGTAACDDFSYWFERNFEVPALVSALRGIDPYMHSLEGLRTLILRQLDHYAPSIR
jgi:hypothetical protein